MCLVSCELCTRYTYSRHSQMELEEECKLCVCLLSNRYILQYSTAVEAGCVKYLLHHLRGTDVR